MFQTVILCHLEVVKVAGVVISGAVIAQNIQHIDFKRFTLSGTENFC